MASALKQALLVLDVQIDYFSDNDLIKRAEELKIPIIYIRNELERTQLLSNFYEDSML